MVASDERKALKSRLNDKNAIERIAMAALREGQLGVSHEVIRVDGKQFDLVDFKLRREQFFERHVEWKLA